MSTQKTLRGQKIVFGPPTWRKSKTLDLKLRKLRIAVAVTYDRVSRVTKNPELPHGYSLGLGIWVNGFVWKMHYINTHQCLLQLGPLRLELELYRP